MTAAAATGGRRRLRMLSAVPVLVAALAVAATLAVPRSAVHGSARSGPEGLAHLRAGSLDYRPTLRWGPHKGSVVLVARPRGGCRVHVVRITSTAPGRVEVDAVETGSPCSAGRRTVERFAVPLPALPDPRREVKVLVGSMSLRLRDGTAAPHPRNASDAD
ncbi:hypothetical protein QDR37_01555 [Amnibacterium sp. CER49]|uniref:hypothetical protein n=1 Tax=Amnibacterium sp. CER49 TaxID=3039161 RepID=UPI0024471F19|nr:hypothetical protein [Amnibacterium sp. CER49]MDH2442621.1 hypothetical protein [Amnibacterium sp. CER49]